MVAFDLKIYPIISSFKIECYHLISLDWFEVSVLVETKFDYNQIRNVDEQFIKFFVILLDALNKTKLLRQVAITSMRFSFKPNLNTDMVRPLVQNALKYCIPYCG